MPSCHHATITGQIRADVDDIHHHVSYHVPHSSSSPRAILTLGTFAPARPPGRRTLKRVCGRAQGVPGVVGVSPRRRPGRPHDLGRRLSALPSKRAPASSLWPPSRCPPALGPSSVGAPSVGALRVCWCSVHLTKTHMFILGPGQNSHVQFRPRAEHVACHGVGRGVRPPPGRVQNV